MAETEYVLKKAFLNGKTKKIIGSKKIPGYKTKGTKYFRNGTKKE
jgi:hypothetical protein